MPLGELYLVLSPDPCNAGGQADDPNAAGNGASDSSKTPPPPSISLQDARDVLWHDKNHARDFRKIVVALISFGIFVTALFQHVPTQAMYAQSLSVSSVLATSGSDTVTDESPVKFLNIGTIPDIFDWLNNTFVPEVFVTEDYNGNALPDEGRGRIAMFNQVLGAVSFQVTHMQLQDCKTQSFLRKLYPSCYDAASATTDELLINFDSNTTAAWAILDEKRASGDWLDFSIQQLLITVVTLNGELQGYLVTKLQLDFNEGGFITPSYSTTPALSNQYPSTRTIVLDILVVLWFSPWMLIPAVASFTIRYDRTHSLTSRRQVKELCRKICQAIGYWSFPDGWMAIDVLRGPIVHAFYITVVITHVAMTDSTFRENLEALRDGGQVGSKTSETLASVTQSFTHIAYLTVLMRLLATAAVLVLGLRILNTFRYHVGLSILTRSMGTAFRWFGTFSVVFAVIFMAFAVSGAVLFGNRVQEFSSLLTSMSTCVNMLFGQFDVDSIREIDYSVVYYWSYMAMETFVLLNIVLAIVVDAYAAERKKKDVAKWWRFRRVVSNITRTSVARTWDLLSSRCCRRDDVRHYVVFWGRIRSRVLYEQLKARVVEETPASDSPREWTPETLLTVKNLKKMIPVATSKECEETLRHLVAGICKGSKATQERQVPRSKEGDFEVGDAVVAPPHFGQKQDSIRASGPTDGSERGDIGIHSPITGYNTHPSQIHTGVSDEKDISTRLAAVEGKLNQLDIAALELKLDFLVEKLTQRAARELRFQ